MKASAFRCEPVIKAYSLGENYPFARVVLIAAIVSGNFFKRQSNGIRAREVAYVEIKCVTIRDVTL
ncbi:hypothetical protein J25TS5_26600 [Paenibacillus faecis]|nr:hypothetical protein J25TS5_26600 [Paenibacillus faecis]